MSADKVPTGQYKRKYPRRVFYGSVGVLVHGLYGVTDSTTLGEGGMSFLHETQIPVNTEIVVTFKIPDDAMISVRAEVRNSRKDKNKDTNKIIHGIQFLPLPIGEKRRIRAYVSARTEEEPII